MTNNKKPTDQSEKTDEKSKDEKVALAMAFLEAFSDFIKEQADSIDWKIFGNKLRAMAGEEISRQWDKKVTKIEDQYRGSKLELVVEGTYAYTLKQIQGLADYFGLDVLQLTCNQQQSENLEVKEDVKDHKKALDQFVIVATDYIFYANNRTEELERKYQKALKALEKHYNSQQIRGFKTMAEQGAKDKVARQTFDPIEEVTQTASNIVGKGLSFVTGIIAKEGTKQVIEGFKATVKGAGDAIFQELDKHREALKKDDMPKPE